MKKILPIGSVVQLHNAEVKLMITTRFPLYNNNGQIGYFDYSGWLYPSGMIDNQSFFFNEENIDKIWFEGYIDGSEEEYRQIANKEITNITYPRFTLENIK